MDADFIPNVMRLIPTDTALATGGIYVPCPPPPGSPPIPWVGIIFGASVVSVLVNAAIVGKTQCRELTLQEALQSVFMPFIGIWFNQHNNMCNPVLDIIITSDDIVLV